MKHIKLFEDFQNESVNGRSKSRWNIGIDNEYEKDKRLGWKKRIQKKVKDKETKEEKNPKNESVYVNISKSLGWDKRTVSIPSKEEIESLYKRAKESDEDAFYDLFKLNRFADPKGDDEIERLNLAVKYFHETESIFRNLD